MIFIFCSVVVREQCGEDSKVGEVSRVEHQGPKQNTWRTDRRTKKSQTGNINNDLTKKDTKTREETDYQRNKYVKNNKTY